MKSFQHNQYIISILNFLKYYSIPIILLVIYSIFAVYFKFDGCISKLIFGLPCPGCGLSRAGISLLMLDFSKAWHYNPIIFLIPFMLLLLIFKDVEWVNKIFKKKILWIIILILIISCYIVRMIMYFPDHDVLCLNYNSLLFKIFNISKT